MLVDDRAVLMSRPGDPSGAARERPYASRRRLRQTHPLSQLLIGPTPIGELSYRSAWRWRGHSWTLIHTGQ